MKVVLEKIKSSHSNLRTDLVEGNCPELPQIGESLRIFGEGIEFGTRVITTTPIAEIFKPSNGEYPWILKTANSYYSFSVLEEDTNEKIC